MCSESNYVQYSTVQSKLIIIKLDHGHMADHHSLVFRANNPYCERSLRLYLYQLQLIK